MNEKLYIIIENDSDDTKEVIEQLEAYCKDRVETHSAAGIEIATFVVNIIDLLVALSDLPLFGNLINRHKIQVKFAGIKLGDTVDEILRTIKNVPEFREMARTAIKNKTIEIEGRGKDVEEFWQKLDYMIRLEE